MSVRMQNISHLNFYAFYKKEPENFLSETEVESHFCNKVSDVSQSQHRQAHIEKRSNLMIYGMKMFKFCDSNTEKRYFSQKKTFKFFGFLHENWFEYEDAFNQGTKSFTTKTKNHNELKKSKTNSLHIAIPKSLNNQKDILVSRSVLKTTNPATFFQKFELRANQFTFTERVNFDDPKCTIYTRSDIKLNTTE